MPQVLTKAPRFQAITWDVDGTLIDSEPLHRDVMVDVCLAAGVDLRVEPEDRYIGLAQDEIWTLLAPRMPDGLTRDAWKTQLIDAYVARAPELHPMPDALSVMRRCADAGIRQIAVSNAGRRALDANIKALGIADILEGSISVDDVVNGKPAPDPYLAGIKLLGLSQPQVIAVEDSAAGARSARSAGLTVATLSQAQKVGGVPISGLADLIAVIFD